MPADPIPATLRIQSNEADWQLGRRVAIASVAVSAVLALANIAVGYVANSTSVLAAGLEFAGDVVASLLVLFGMMVAARPADSNHPYGHGRAEILTALAVGTILFLAGIGISFRSLQKIDEIHPAPPLWALWPLVGAIVARAGMAALKFRVGKRIQSSALAADAWNDLVDIISAFAALTALGLSLADSDRFRAADHYGGFAVGFFVIITGLRVLRESSLELMDTMPDGEQIAQIRAHAVGVPGVVAIEKCYARKTGLQYHVDLHVEVDPHITVQASHEIASEVRAHLRAKLPWVADVLVHIEPAGGAMLP
ncbi:MAG: cation transporter [Bryobacterales bacterium]|nr:cation transporter [Bryobacterales bacterium]